MILWNSSSILCSTTNAAGCPAPLVEMLDERQAGGSSVQCLKLKDTFSEVSCGHFCGLTQLSFGFVTVSFQAGLSHLENGLCGCMDNVAASPAQWWAPCLLLPAGRWNHVFDQRSCVPAEGWIICARQDRMWGGDDGTHKQGPAEEKSLNSGYRPSTKLFFWVLVAISCWSQCS